MRIRGKAYKEENIVKIGEIVCYSTKIYRKLREMSVINREKIVRDDRSPPDQARIPVCKRETH